MVAGQRITQAATDAFLGYTEGPDRSYYVRQLRDMKWSPNPLSMSKKAYETYAGLCGAALARAHARSGDSVAIAAYLGSGDAFKRAIQDFSDAYTQQNSIDFSAFTQAIANDQLAAVSDANASTRITLLSDDAGSVHVLGRPQ